MNNLDQYVIWVIQLPHRLLLKHFKMIKELEDVHPDVPEIVETHLITRGLIVEGMLV